MRVLCAQVLESTPRNLVEGGLYNSVAVDLIAGRAEEVSAAMFAREIGAVRIRPREIELQKKKKELEKAKLELLNGTKQQKEQRAVRDTARLAAASDVIVREVQNAKKYSIKVPSRSVMVERVSHGVSTVGSAVPMPCRPSHRPSALSVSERAES